MVVVKEMPRVDISTQPSNFGKFVDRAFRDVKPVIVSGFDPELDRTARALMDDFVNFSELPDDNKREYCYPKLAGQFGFTPQDTEQSGYAGGKDSAGGKLQEHREHFMIGSQLPEGHPLLDICPPFIYFDAKNAVGFPFPDMVTNGNRLVELVEDARMRMYAGLEQARGLPPGSIAFIVPYGTTVVRLHHYPGIRGDIVKEYEVNGVKAIDMLLPSGELKKGLVYAADHTDIDCTAWLLRANKPGFAQRDKTGNVERFTAGKDYEGSAVVNVGDYGKFMSNPDWTLGAAPFGTVQDGGYGSGVHWVEINTETMQDPRFSIVAFGHNRPTVVVCDKIDRIVRPNIASVVRRVIPEVDRRGVRESEALYARLAEIGYLGSTEAERLENLAGMLEALRPLPSDREVVKEILGWERTQPEDSPYKGRLGQFYERRNT